MVSTVQSRARQVDEIIRRMRKALEEDDNKARADIGALLDGLLLAEGYPEAFDRLLDAFDPVRGAFGNAGPLLLERFSGVVHVEHQRLEKVARDAEERKSGTWNYVILGSAGFAFLGLAALLTGADSSPISPLGAILLAVIAFFALYKRKQAHKASDEATQKTRALDLLKEKMARKLAK